MPLPALIAAAQEIEIKGVFRRFARVRARARLKNSRHTESTRGGEGRSPQAQPAYDHLQLCSLSAPFLNGAVVEPPTGERSTGAECDKLSDKSESAPNMSPSSPVRNGSMQKEGASKQQIEQARPGQALAGDPSATKHQKQRYDRKRRHAAGDDQGTIKQPRGAK